MTAEDRIRARDKRPEPAPIETHKARKPKLEPVEEPELVDIEPDQADLDDITRPGLGDDGS